MGDDMYRQFFICRMKFALKRQLYPPYIYSTFHLSSSILSENMAAILALGGSPSGMRREAELSRTVSLPVTPIAISNPASMHVAPRSHSAPELLEAGDAHGTLPTLDFTPVVVEAEIEMAAILALGGSPSGMRWEAESARTVSLPVTPIAHSNPESAMDVVPRSHSAPELLEAGDAHGTLPTLDFTPAVVEAVEC
uniref:Uncharacterized protein n=1 Tax=Tanacetum cinerariifolium TaxID=118510 RepID=A0A6L2JJH3_TANCI|nr:hypothetical protein [Tanacetum cinerariifolium]